MFEKKYRSKKLNNSVLLPLRVSIASASLRVMFSSRHEEGLKDINIIVNAYCD